MTQHAPVPQRIDAPTNDTADSEISVAREMVFCNMTFHLLLKILSVAMFGVLSLLMSFLLCAVYLSCFMSCADTLRSAFLRVMSLCMQFVICQPVECALFLSFFLLRTLCTISIINNK